MPNGTRVGHYYTTRTGRRAYRGPAKINAPVGSLLLLGGLVAVGLATGGAPLLAHPWVIVAVAGVVGGGLLARGWWKRSSNRRAAVRRDQDRHDTYKAVHENRARVKAREAKRQAKQTRRQDRLRQRQTGDRRTFTRAARPTPSREERVYTWLGVVQKSRQFQQRQERARHLGGRVDGDRIVCPDGRTYSADPEKAA